MEPARNVVRMAGACSSTLGLAWPSAWILPVLLVAVAACREPTAPQRCAALPSVSHWTNLGPAGEWITAVAITRAGLLVGTPSDGVMKYDSCDGRWGSLGLAGRFITSITSVPPPSNRVLVTVTPLPPDTVSALLYGSDDNGTTWYPLDGGLSSQRAYYGYAFSLGIDALDPDRIYLGLPAAIARSVNGGATWSSVFGDSIGPGLAVWAIAPSRSGSARVWAAGQDPGSRAWVLRSDDRGSTWLQFWPSGNAEDAVLSLAPDPRNDDHVFVGSGGGIRASEDAGSTWESVFSLPAPGFVTGLSLVNSTIVAIADEQVPNSAPVRNALGMYVSQDGGVSWDSVSVPPAASGGLALTISAGSVAFVATRSGLWTVPLP